MIITTNTRKELLNELHFDKINSLRRKINEYIYAIGNLESAIKVFENEYEKRKEKEKEEKELFDSYLILSKALGTNLIIEELGLTQEFYDNNKISKDTL